MSPRRRLLLTLAALMLGAVYVLPLWRVTLEAPQYPGGLGMLIHVDTITGVGRHDLQNINGLNHYIGMKPIVPEAIPELVWMPYLFAGLIALGLLAAAIGRRWALYLWTFLFAAVLAIGFVDYYKWGYDYGHDLSPDAAIKIPDASYQPPIIGWRTILNFKAHSWPDTGGVVVFLSFALAFGLSVAEFRRRRRGRDDDAAVLARADAATAAHSTSAPLAPAVLPLLLLAAAGCTPGPVALRYGEDVCTHCRMTLSDPAFGAEIVAPTGRTYPFDSIECLLAHLEANPDEERHGVWVVPMDDPGTLVEAAGAHYLRSRAIRSPMGGGLAAFTLREAREEARLQGDGEVLDWAALATPAAAFATH